MSNLQTGLALCPVDIYRHDIVAMVRLVKTLYRLSQMPAYQQLVAAEIPEIARFDPGHQSLMMGYDFHLSEIGPQLIEVNTNAGGGLLAYRTREPDRPEHELEPSVRTKEIFLQTFAWEMQQFSGGVKKRPSRVVVMDETPQKQFLHPEMEACVELLEQWGVWAVIAAPEELQGREDGIYYGDERVDFIYNRHCDFYLETPALQMVRAAYLKRQLCLSPNPRAYGLLADKRRLLRMSDPELATELGLNDAMARQLAARIPQCKMLADMDEAEVWTVRKKWAFKPVSGFGSRGVILGTSMSRKRFAQLGEQEILMQSLVPPSRTPCNDSEKGMKTDIRLFVYQDRVLGIAARIYKGQVTNFRDEGSGYAPVRIVNG